LRMFFGDGLFKKNLYQKLLGYVLKEDGLVEENCWGMNLRYRFDSLPGRCVFLGGVYEEKDFSFCLDSIRAVKNPVLIDAGANAGFHSMRWLQRREDLHLVAIEASPETATLLSQNIAQNGFGSRCQVKQLALGDKNQEVEFILSRDDAFSSLFANNRTPEKERVRVAMRTLDQVVEEIRLSKIDLIKIDVEGAEHMVILGAKNTLERFRPKIFMEIYSGNNPSISPDETIRLMESMHYETRVVVDGEALPLTKHDDRNMNYYFLPL
jgi:FkbM family methyltransferase